MFSFDQNVKASFLNSLAFLLEVPEEIIAEDIDLCWQKRTLRGFLKEKFNKRLIGYAHPTGTSSLNLWAIGIAKDRYSLNLLQPEYDRHLFFGELGRGDFLSELPSERFCVVGKRGKCIYTPPNDKDLFGLRSYDAIFWLVDNSRFPSTAPMQG